MAADPCRIPTPSEAARGARPRPQGVTDVVIYVVESIVSAIRSLADTLYNSALITHAPAHAMLSPSKAVAVTAGTAKAVVTNKSQEPVVVFVRGESTGDGTPIYLMLALTVEDCTIARAARALYENSPETTIILPPNATLYADLSAGVAGVERNVVYTVLPIKGALGLFKA